jgi:hypothetical protein
MAGRIAEIAKSLAPTSTDEANAIIAIHSNRIFPDGMPIEQQMQEAYYIAHGPRLVAKTAELRRTVRSKTTTKTVGSDNSHRDETKVEPKGVDPQTRAELSRLGYKWDGVNFAKKLTNGKTLIRDTKSGKTYVKN